MDLSALDLEDRYKRKTGFDLLEQFYIPVLENSSYYDRIAGYFSSAVLSEASRGFAKFCKNHNFREIPKFRLIVGARLSEQDEELILHLNNKGEIESDLSENLVNSILRISAEESHEFDMGRFEGLSWMIKNNLLEIKVGIRFDPNSGRVMRHNEAEFHSKIGILSDGNNMVSFEGSANETKRGWVENYESISVFRSWENGESRRINHHISDFEELWNSDGKNNDLGVAVYSFPEAAKMELLEKFPPRIPTEYHEIDWAKKRREYLVKIKGSKDRWKQGKRDFVKLKPKEKTNPNSNKWRHQKEAVDWFLDKSKANGVGIFQMATGSGKTRTAISAIKSAFKKGLANKAVICMPKTLEKQWEAEVSEHFPERFGDFWWKSGINQSSDFFDLPLKDAVLFVSHFFIPDLIKYVEKKSTRVGKTMIIIDELHNIGSEKYKNILTETTDSNELDLDLGDELFHKFKVRLGLSATPWSEYDDIRNQFIVNNFVRENFEIKENQENWQDELINGKHVYYFGLESGIERGILVEFDYKPIEYVPSEEDFEKRKQAFTKVPPNLSKQAQAKLGMILAAEVFKSSKEKFAPFSEWLKSRENILNRAILFVANKEFGNELTSILASEHRIYEFREFFEGEHFDTLVSFGKEELDLLIACRRISEGVDIRAVDTIVLFSSNASRLETIQRIGRALRLNQSDPDKRALIVDLVYSKEKDSSDYKRMQWLERLSQTRREKDE